MSRITIRKYNDDSSDDVVNTTECGIGWIDGYSIAERLLEGLPICIKTINDGYDIKVSAEWPPGIDKQYWIDFVRASAFEGCIVEMHSTKEMQDADCLMFVED